MGDFEIINIKTGQRLRLDKDGSEIRDEVPVPILEWCDTGQHYATKVDGKYDGSDGITMLWRCGACG